MALLVLVTPVLGQERSQIRRTGWRPHPEGRAAEAPQPLLPQYASQQNRADWPHPTAVPATPRAATLPAPQPVRRLSELPIGVRSGASKPPGSMPRAEMVPMPATFGRSTTPVRAAGGQEDSEPAVSRVIQDRETLSDLALKSRDIREIRPFISYAMQDIEDAELPRRRTAVSKETYSPPARTPVTFTWMASNLYHNPLYFEDPALERYGHTYHPLVQPFASAGRFTTQLVGLPYQMAIDPIQRRRYTLGWYRPGDCAPKKHYQIPLNKKAAAVEAGVVTGAFFLFP